jgi:hypothetical protein
VEAFRQFHSIGAIGEQAALLEILEHIHARLVDSSEMRVSRLF